MASFWAIIKSLFQQYLITRLGKEIDKLAVKVEVKQRELDKKRSNIK